MIPPAGRSRGTPPGEAGSWRGERPRTATHGSPISPTETAAEQFVVPPLGRKKTPTAGMSSWDTYSGISFRDVMGYPEKNRHPLGIAASETASFPFRDCFSMIPSLREARTDPAISSFFQLYGMHGAHGDTEPAENALLWMNNDYGPAPAGVRLLPEGYHTPLADIHAQAASPALFRVQKDVYRRLFHPADRWLSKRSSICL